MTATGTTAKPQAKPETKAPAKGEKTGKGDAPPVEKTPEIKWIEEFGGVAKQSGKKAEINQKRGQIIGAATLDLDLARGTLGGFDFKMTRKPDSSLTSRVKAKLGMEDKMDSLTGSGDAMNEIDTFHDLKDLMSIDPETGKKAQKAMELVSNAAQSVDKKMQALLCDEAGMKPAEIEALEAAHQQVLDYNKRADVISARRNKVEPPKMDPPLTVDPKKLEIFKDIRGTVDQTVRDEVWMPMVREGVMPENLVPDRQSEVARTFEGASASYNDRLDDYTKSLGDNDELLKSLGIAKKVVDLGVKAAQEAIKLAGASVPVDQIETAITLFKITEATAFTVAEQIIKKEDAASFLDTALKAAKQVVDAVVPESVAIFVDAGLDIAMTGSKAIKAVMSGNVDDFLAAVADGITQSLGVADSARGTTDLAPLGALVAGAVRQAAAGAKLAVILKTKPLDEKAFKAALAAFVQASMKEIGNSITMVVNAETANIKGGQDTVAKIDKGVAIGSDGIGALMAAGLSDDPLADVTKALGDIANKSCVAFMDPSYGKTVGAALKTGLADGMGKFLPALVKGDPEAALKALGDMLSNGVAAAGDAKTLSPAAQDALSHAADAVKTFVATCNGANDLRKAITSKDPAAIQKAMKKILDAVAGELSAELIAKAGDDDSTAGDDSSDDDGGDADGDADDNSGKELAPGEEKKQKELLDSLKEIVAKADEIMAAGTPADKVAKAKEAKAKATKEMVEQATLKSAFEAESSAFAAQLAESFGGDQADDEAQEKTLKELIVKLQRDRKIFEMVNSLLDMGIAAAAQLFPPMGAALDFKKFTVEVGMAVMHAKALLEWKRNADEAKNAVTVQAHTMLNRVGLEEDAVIEHNIKASLALVSAIGQVIATVGAHAAPVGVAMSGGAKLGSILLEAALLVKSEVEMRAAWSIYQKALKEPRDRKVVRMALQTNASLAKYAMVWGAQKDNNPIAKKVLKRCGVTAKMLEKEQGDSQQIVAYLEELFHDDPIVLRATPDMTGWGWEAPAPKLTLRGWTDFLSVAQSKGKPKMKSGTGGRMTGIMASLDKGAAAYKKAETDLSKAKAFLDKLQALDAADAATEAPKPGEDKKVPAEDKAMVAIRARIEKAVAAVGTTSQAYQAALKSVGSEAKAFKPIDENDKPYQRIVEYMDAIAALAELEIKKLAGETVAVDLAA